MVSLKLLLKDLKVSSLKRVEFFMSRQGRKDKCFPSYYINNQTVGSLTPAKSNDSVGRGGKIAETRKANIRKAFERTRYLMSEPMS